MPSRFDTWVAADGQFRPFDFHAGCIHALGLTYADHIRETGEKPGVPVVFQKNCILRSEAPTVATPSSAMLLQAIQRIEPSLATWLVDQIGELPALLDYEVEIGMVMGQDVTLAQLDDPAFALQVGLFVANDMTARCVQIAGEGSADKLQFWSAAKSFPDFLPVGAQMWCPHRSNLDGFPELRLETRVNGILRQSASTRDLIYTPREMLRFAARQAPDGLLRMHDIVLTGTPAGIAMSVPRWKRRIAALLPARARIRAALRMNRDNARFLRPGDEVTFSAGWLGSQTLHVAAAMVD